MLTSTRVWVLNFLKFRKLIISCLYFSLSLCFSSSLTVIQSLLQAYTIMDEALISNTTPQSSQDNVSKLKMLLPKSRVGTQRFYIILSQKTQRLLTIFLLFSHIGQLCCQALCLLPPALQFTCQTLWQVLQKSLLLWRLPAERLVHHRSWTTSQNMVRYSRIWRRRCRLEGRPSIRQRTWYRSQKTPSKRL